jgi:hypothetical protein
MSPAFSGRTERKPKPNADTATSAMRLIDVFVDICFLSLKVKLEDFSNSAWREMAFSSDMSEPFLGLWGSEPGGLGVKGQGSLREVHAANWSGAGY